MTGKELLDECQKLHNIQRHRFDEAQVRIIIQKQGTVGPIPTVGISTISLGFDWNNGKLLINADSILEEVKK